MKGVQAQMLEELKAIHALLEKREPETQDPLPPYRSATPDLASGLTWHVVLDEHEDVPMGVSAILVETDLTADQVEFLKQDDNLDRVLVVKVVSVIEPPNRPFEQIGGLPIFWTPEWRNEVFIRISEAIAKGYDGIVLADADSYLDLRQHMKEEALLNHMSALVASAAHYARALKPNAIVMLYDAEALYARPMVVRAIDGAIKEDLFYGVQEDDQPNDPIAVEWSLSLLRRLDKPVVVIENVGRSLMDVARRKAETHGFAFYCATR
jgi:hypothetical protein